MIINVHAGHNPDGKPGCGAIGLIKESTEARLVKDRVIALLRTKGHTVYDCTEDNGTGQSDVLTKIVRKCNAHKADIDVSIHFNAGRNAYIADGQNAGAEVWIYSETSQAKDAAERICRNVSTLGYNNRGVKTSKNLYVLRKTTAPALLVECCFVDDADDVALYNADTMARAIAEGITGETISYTEEPTQDGFMVKVKSRRLNIRAGAGKKYKRVGKIKDRGAYTIVETIGNWGRLASGAGWICISDKYVMRL